jgi:hypothetical protein
MSSPRPENKAQTSMKAFCEGNEIAPEVQWKNRLGGR